MQTPTKPLDTQVNPGAHPHQLQGDTIRLHFAQTTHNGHQQLQNTSPGIHLSPPKQQESTETKTTKGKTLDTETRMLHPTRTEHHGVNTSQKAVI